MSNKEDLSPALEALFAAIERHPPLLQRSSLFNPPDNRPSGAVYYVFDVALTEQDDAMVMHVVSQEPIPVTTTPPARAERPSTHTDLPTLQPRPGRSVICDLMLRSIEREIREIEFPWLIRSVR